MRQDHYGFSKGQEHIFLSANKGLKIIFEKSLNKP